MNTEELHRPLSGAERDELGAFLESSPTAMPFPRADGFLTAAASAPTMMPPSQWHPLLLGDHTFESNREAERILGLLLRRWNEIVARLEAGRQASPSTSSNDEDLRAWCQGYLEASRLDPQWMADDRGVDELLPFGVLAGEFDLVGETASDGAVIEDDSTGPRDPRLLAPATARAAAQGCLPHQPEDSTQRTLSLRQRPQVQALLWPALRPPMVRTAPCKWP